MEDKVDTAFAEIKSNIEMRVSAVELFFVFLSY